MAATGPSSPDTTKETPSAEATAVEAAKRASVDSDSAAATSSTPIMPTYLSTKQSRAYTLSKQLLAAGSLDDALSTLEMALQFSNEMLAANLNSCASADADIDIELHESLAPLYYLYGTTLLYSVEESDVMMANGNGSGNGVAPADVDVEDNNVPPENNKSEPQQVQKQKQEEEEDGNEEEEEAAAPIDPTEDLQIAWENLDLARSIVAQLTEGFNQVDHENEADSSNSTTIVFNLKSNTTTQNDDDDDDVKAITGKTDSNSNSNKSTNMISLYTQEQQKELLLDLAQIHTRLGDLQRANDNILPCIDDYNLALQLRLKCSGRYDKKVADSHFSLAGAYAEAPNKVGETEGRVDQFVSSLGGGGGGDGSENHNGNSNVNSNGDSQEVLSESEKREFRQRSLEHYLACGVAFAGLMVEACGEDAERFTHINIDDESNADDDDDDGQHCHSKTLATLRQRLSKLQPPAGPSSNSNSNSKDDFYNLKEMMDEIQEAIDSAEETEEGLKSLGEMKANEMKKHERNVKNVGIGEEEVGVDNENGGVITTIGFGTASASAATAVAAPTTMMVVKKKKKKTMALHSDQLGDSAKRLKTN